MRAPTQSELDPGLRMQDTSECLTLVFSAKLGVRELAGQGTQRALCGLEPGHPPDYPGSLTASAPLLPPFSLLSPLASANADSSRDRDLGMWLTAELRSQHSQSSCKGILISALSWSLGRRVCVRVERNTIIPLLLPFSKLASSGTCWILNTLFSPCL